MNKEQKEAELLAELERLEKIYAECPPEQMRYYERQLAEVKDKINLLD